MSWISLTKPLWSESKSFDDSFDSLRDDSIDEIGREEESQCLRSDYQKLLRIEQNQRRNHQTALFCKNILGRVLFAFALWGLVDVSIRSFHSIKSTLQRNTPQCWCGSSDLEAIEMGCRYDHIAVDWLPPSCIDDDLVEEFDVSRPGPDGSWPYFEIVRPTPLTRFLSPINATQIDDFAREGREYFATREWHILHCMFTWRKQLRAGFDGKHVESWNNKEEHVRHCSDYIMEVVRSKSNVDEVDTEILGVDRHSEAGE